MRTAVRPRNHGRKGASAEAIPREPSPTAPRTSGPIQQMDESRPAISDPARAFRSFTTRGPLGLEVVARIRPELLGTLVATGHVILLGEAYVRATRVYREDDAAHRALRELAGDRPGLGLHVLGLALELRGAREAARARHRRIEVACDLPSRALTCDGRCLSGRAARAACSSLR